MGALTEGTAVVSALVRPTMSWVLNGSVAVSHMKARDINFVPIVGLLVVSAFPRS